MDTHETNSQSTHKSSRFDKTIAISTLALLVSLAVGLFTAWNELNKEAATTRQSLTNILEQITDIDRETIEFQAMSIPDEQKEFASFSFVNRKILLLRQAEELYKKLGEKTTAEDAAVISVAYFGTGDFEKAESYMKVCLGKAKTRILRASALRSLANLAIARGDHSLATELYDKASNEIGIPKSDVEINFIMVINLFKVQHSITRNDYDSAATSLQELAVNAQHLLCTTARGQWLERIYGIERMLTPHLGGNISALPKGDGKAKCIFDPPRSNFVKSAESLSRYAGAYIYQNHRLRVFMWDDDTLSIAIPGQPLHILRAKKDKGHFEILGLLGYTVIFHPGLAGDISKLEFIQPDGRYLWSRSM